MRARDGAHIPGLFWTLVRTDFKVRYHRTIAGFFWTLLKPITMFLVLMGVFSFVFAQEPSYRLNLIIGLFLYEFFSEATKTGLHVLLAKGYLLTKARCPVWIVVVASVSNAVITLAIVSSVLFLYLAAIGRPPDLTRIAAYVLYQICFLLITIGFALAASVLFLRYRDLNQIWEVVAHAGFFVAPVIYPLEILPERFHRVLYLWPPTPIIQFTRSVLVEGVLPSLRAHLLLFAMTATILLVGALVFRFASANAAEYV